MAGFKTGPRPEPDYDNRVYCKVINHRDFQGGYTSSIPIWSNTPKEFESQRYKIFAGIIEQRDPFQRGTDIEMRTAYEMIGKLG